MPGPRIEISQTFIFHLIHFGEDLNSELIWIHMIDRNVMPNVVSTRPPDEREIVPGKMIASSMYLCPISCFKSYVMKPLLLIGDKINCMVVDVAAQESKTVCAPIGHSEAQYLRIEFHHSLDVVAAIGDMTQFDQRKCRLRVADFGELVVREYLQKGPFGIFNGDGVFDARCNATTPLDYEFRDF